MYFLRIHMSLSIHWKANGLKLPSDFSSAHIKGSLHEKFLPQKYVLPSHSKWLKWMKRGHVWPKTIGWQLSNKHHPIYNTLTWGSLFSHKLLYIQSWLLTWVSVYLYSLISIFIKDSSKSYQHYIDRIFGNAYVRWKFWTMVLAKVKQRSKPKQFSTKNLYVESCFLFWSCDLSPIWYHVELYPVEYCKWYFL